MKIFIDEAGRWPLAWPLYVGLVMENEQFEFRQVDDDFRDSKALSAKRREGSYLLLMNMKKQGLKLSTGRARAEEIDRFWVTRAIVMAIERGLHQLYMQLHPWEKKKKNLTFGEVELVLEQWLKKSGFELLIDGKTDFWLRKALNIPVETLVKGDAKVKWIAMASILAKVERDHSMIALGKELLEWDFAQHKGYGTQAHYAKIQTFGVSNQHRKLFLKKYFPDHKIQPFDSSFWFEEKPLF